MAIKISKGAPVSTRILILAVAIGIPVRAQVPLKISVNQRRPLEAALDQLEKKLGIPINYEDPKLACSSEIEDVTDQVQSPAQKVANPNVRIVVPKKGTISVDSVVSATPQIADALSLATELRLQYEANGYPGRFTVKQVGSVPTVEPVSTRGGDCAWATVTPVMETSISFPAQARNAGDTLSVILKTVAEKVGVKIATASVPVIAFMNRSITLGANDEPANTVLVKLFEQLSSGPAAYSYHLFYDPGLKYYLIDIAAVQPLRPSVQPLAAGPQPSGGHFGGTPIK
jgi:hypothetical protein